MGGGRKRLTVKSRDECGKFEPQENAIRRNGNFIYEEYLPTNGFIIKVYAIGPYYMHAEARKSVTLDGVVQRNAEGKEMRFPVMLTPEEKLLCNKIVQEFGQEVCGMELLRSGCSSYVCSVNGWSFAKNSPRYWNDCAVILKRRIFHHFCPEKTHHLARAHFEQFVQDTYRPPLNHPDVRPEELRSIVTIFRHADRSPKEKLKIRTKDPRFIALLGEAGKEVKLKDAKSLTRVLAITN
jgi:inositol hexakisphosphate/diphosphoinositol-pentakisphosphate kinase